MEVVEMAVADIRPYEKNTKRHKISRIKESITQFKVDQPIVVDQNNVIIKGHGRHEAAVRLGMKTFPVIVRGDLTDEQVRLARIADNRSGEAGWNKDLLEQELEGLGIKDLDMAKDLGIDDDFFKELGIFGHDTDMGDMPGGGDDGSEESGKAVACPKCGFEFKV